MLNIVVGAMLVVVVMIVVVAVFLRYKRDSTSSITLVFQGYKFIWKLFFIEPQRHKLSTLKYKDQFA